MHRVAQSLRLRLLVQALAAAARVQTRLIDHQGQVDLAVNTSSLHNLHLRLVPLEEQSQSLLAQEALVELVTRLRRPQGLMAESPHLAPTQSSA
jgi:hypothetical protein